MRRKLPLLALVMICSAAATRSQDVGTIPGVVPPIYALKGATVVVGNGEVLSNSTVVVRDGLIEAVGPNVSVPPLAWEIDASGMYIYPGLIDALTEEGLRRQPTPPRTAQGPAEPRSAEPSGEAPGMFAHIRAADRLETDLSKLASWRDSGILTLHVAPDTGIFMGQTALINVSGENTDEIIVRSPLTMRMSWRGTGGFRTFPGSLMGVLAHIRQTLLDAQHYGLAHQIYGKNPRGLKRPETDHTLEALQPVVANSMPLLFSASQEREILRAVDLSRELKLKSMVVGGWEAPEVVSFLKENQVPVLLSLNFPQKERDTHPEAEESLRILRRRQQAPRAAAELHKAGLPFAFCSDGLKSGADYLKNLRRAVEEGLPREAAIRAATLSAAEILGVEQQLGSIEKGKIANLVVTDLDLFEEKARVKHVFIDGKKFDVPAPEKPEEKKEEADQPPSLGGVWDVEVTAPETTYRIQFDLTQDGSTLSGRVVSPEGRALDVYDGSAGGDRFSFKIRVDFGSGPQEVTFSGNLSGDSVSGTAQVSERRSAPFTGQRRPR